MSKYTSIGDIYSEYSSDVEGCHPCANCGDDCYCGETCGESESCCCAYCDNCREPVYDEVDDYDSDSDE